MNFVFERDNKNFIACQDVNRSGIGRITPSPMIETLIRFATNRFQFDNLDLTKIRVSNSPLFKRYIIAAGVTHSPNDWIGVDSQDTGNVAKWYPERRSLFEYIKPSYLSHLRAGRAYMLLDQCHEGYHEDYIFEWFHHGCDELGINPRQMIYVTGDLDVTRKYDAWCDQRGIKNKMCTIGHPHFERSVYEHSLNRVRIHNQPALLSVDEQIEHKRQNADRIRLYNALQKRPRAHRAWLFYSLAANGLLADGINSMNFVDHNSTYYMGRFMEAEQYEIIKPLMPMLPPTDEHADKELQDFSNVDSGKYQMRLNHEIMYNSWFSVISEAAFGENQCFISEKTFKPLVVGHPFIVYGNRYSMAYLREMGYRTFHPWIDETYDTLDTWERLEAIVQAINKIKSLTPAERLEWYAGMRDILLHNQEVIRRNSKQSITNSYVKLLEHYQGS